MITKEDARYSCSLLRIHSPLEDLTVEKVIAAWSQLNSQQWYINLDPGWGRQMSQARDSLLMWLQQDSAEPPEQDTAGVPRKPQPLGPESSIALQLPEPEEQD
jgi:hypothetical protein